MLGRQVLTARYEDQCFFHCFAVGRFTGGFKGIQKELCVRKIGPFVIAIALPAIEVTIGTVILSLIPLQALQKARRFFNQHIVLIGFVRGTVVFSISITSPHEAHNSHAGLVIPQVTAIFIDTTVGL